MQDELFGDCGCPEIVDPCDPCGNVMTPIIEEPCGSIMTPVVEDSCGPCDGASILATEREYYEGTFHQNGQIQAQPVSTSTEEVTEEETDPETTTEEGNDVADSAEHNEREDLSHNEIRKPSFLKRMKNWLS